MIHDPTEESLSAAPRASLPRLAGVLLVVLALASTGCSAIERIVINRAAEGLTSTGTVYTGDDDPELIAEALPFTLKLTETMLAKSPENQNLLLAACSGFTSYAAGFVEPDAYELEYVDYERSRQLLERSFKLFRRAKGYCLQALELRYPGIKTALLSDPEAALERTDEGDVALLYWSGASWGAAIAMALDRPEVVIDLPAARALIERALELDPAFQRGALHEAMISVEALPETMGGSIERARVHFEKAVELSRGYRASPYVTWALKVSVPEQDYAEFKEMLDKALAIDAENLPDAFEGERLGILIAQERARHLRDQAEDLFLVTGGEDADMN